MKIDFETLLLMYACTAVFSCVCVGVLVKYAPIIGLVDSPNERSMHKSVTPRGGGIGIVLTVALSVILICLNYQPRGSDLHLLRSLKMLGGAALFIAAVSLRDDFKSLSSGLRILCQLASAVVAIWACGGFLSLDIPSGEVELGWVGVGLTIFWILGLTNVYNFMDGLDGIAGTHGVLVGLAWTVFGVVYELPLVALLSVALSGSCLGFLFHNWSPAKIFMGDVGSAFLGFTFAVLPLLALNESAGVDCALQPGRLPLIVGGAMWPFIGDGFFTFVRRARKGETVWKPHRTHLYQRLAQTGWRHAHVTTLYAAWCLCSIGAATIALRAGDSWCAYAIGATYGLGSLGGILTYVTWREIQTRSRDA